MVNYQDIPENEGRRLHYDNDDAKIYDNMKNIPGPFKGATIIDIFSIALIYGKKQGYRVKLGSKGSSIGRVVESVIDNSQLRYLMMAIAAEEMKSIDVCIDVDQYFTICEEYAKAGLPFLQSDFIDKDEELLDDMEIEMLKFYKENFEKSEE